MAQHPTRRKFLIGGTSALAAAGLAPWPGRKAFAAEELTAVEWGGVYIDNMKPLVAKYGKYDMTWELHAGGSAAILPKIRSQWPDNLVYDMVAAWTPVFLSMIREGWLETVTPENVPNIVDIPESLIDKDDQGNFKTIPRNIGAGHFAYRKDLCPIEIKHIEDFLNPRLKGQICWPDPVYGTNQQMVMLALARGGDEKNMEPGWEFMKELAKSGNIGRVYKTETDLITSMSTGETSLGHSAAQNFIHLSEQNLPIVQLSKVDDPGLKTTIYVEGWSVLKGPRSAAAFDLANHTISAENNTWWAEKTGSPPVNEKSKAPEAVEHIVFTDEEIQRYAYLPDWDHISKQVDANVKRFEQEIVPLL